jgi:hypothetical protein
MRIRLLLAAASALVLPLASAPVSHASTGTSLPQAVQPFTEAPFAADCTWHQFGEGETPPWWLLLDDPVCVEYSKRDITLDNGGALRFLLAEPARLALAVPSCRYAQHDHWSVQPTTGATPWVAWDGSYWFDRGTGVLAGHLANFRINGVTAGIGDVVQALRPVFPDVADALAAYGSAYGESGLEISIPTSWLC